MGPVGACDSFKINSAKLPVVVTGMIDAQQRFFPLSVATVAAESTASVSRCLVLVHNEVRALLPVARQPGVTLAWFHFSAAAPNQC